MEQHIVTIYKIKEKSHSDYKPSSELTIDDGRIKFLKNILLTTSEFFTTENGDWLLTFFTGKSYEQRLLVKNSTHPLNMEISHFKKEKLAHQKYDSLTSLSAILVNAGKMNDDFAERLSIAVRESKAIKVKNYTEYPSHYEHFDGRGLSFFSHIENQMGNFQRRVILVSLAYAYLGAIEFLSNRLAEIINAQNCNIDELRKVYIEATKFNSVYFFHLPVLIKNASLTEAWRAIDKILEINVSANELLDQMSSVYYILNLNEEKKKEHQEKQDREKQERWNLRFSIIGIIIGLLSLLDLFRG